jgi:hypothetical protein
VATAADLAAYHGLTRRHVEELAPRSALVRVEVEGWGRPAFAASEALSVLGRRMRTRSLLLSPFDSLTWYRERTERVFGFRHRLEAYVPKAKRQHGYFSMPVLGGDRLVGLVDPGRAGKTLVAKHVSLETSDAADHVAAALSEAARWVGCESVVVERVTPPEGAAVLAAALAAVQS